MSQLFPSERIICHTVSLQSINIFILWSCSTVSFNRKSAISVLYQQSVPLFLVSLCTITLHRAAPPSGGPPPSTSNGGLNLGLWCCYMIMCYSFVNVYTNMRQYHLTIQVKLGCPTDWLTSLNLSPSAERVQHPLVLYAEQLTMLLALPLWVAHCLYSKSGLFWAKWLSGQNNLPSLLKI